VNILNYAFLVVYTIEALGRLYAYRTWYFFVSWNILDMCVVVSGIIDLALSSQLNGFGNLQTLRVFRILRLLRTVRLLTFFPELYEMLRGFGSAMKAMLWGITIIIIMLGLWSLLAVEIVHPRNHGIEHKREYCVLAFSSVQRATLFFFQTLVAGDSWGECTIPIIMESWEVIIVFAGALVSVQLGFTNLILAVIVEAAARARERDLEHRLKEKKRYERKCLEEWHTVIESLDNDQSGTISMEELKLGFQTQPALSKILELLDIDKQDLESFFRLMDNDNSGDVSYTEFYNCLRKAHSQDMRMYLMNVKLQVCQISSLLNKQLEVMTQGFTQLNGTSPVHQAKAKSMNNEAKEPKDLPNCRVSMHSAEVASEIPEKMPRAPHLSQPLKTGHLGSDISVVADTSLHSAFKIGLEGLRHELEERLDRLSTSVAQNSKSLEALLVSCGLDESTEPPEAPPVELVRGRSPSPLPNGRLQHRLQVSHPIEHPGRASGAPVLGIAAKAKSAACHVFAGGGGGHGLAEAACSSPRPSHCSVGTIGC